MRPIVFALLVIAALGALSAGSRIDRADGMAAPTTAHPVGTSCATPLPSSTPMTMGMDMDMDMGTLAAGGAATMAPMSGMAGMANMAMSTSMPAVTMGADSTMPSDAPPVSPDCARAVGVSEGDFYVRAAQTEFRVGQPYVFVVSNVGKVQHMFVIEPNGAVHQPLMRGNVMAMVHGIEPGHTITLAWTFAAPGAYQLACHEPGHYEAGMVEAVRVTP